MACHLVQGGDNGRASIVGMEGPAPAAAMQDAMQLMFGPDGTTMHFPLPSTAQQDQEQQQQEQGSLSNKPALMQRLSVLARGPADSPSLRPFNMLASPDAATSFAQPGASLCQPQGEATGLQERPVSPHADMGDMGQLSQPALSMTGVVADAAAGQEPWVSSQVVVAPPAAKKGRKHSTAADSKHSKAKSGRLHAICEAGVEFEGLAVCEQHVQPEFSFSPLGDSSGRIQEIAFSPLAAGAGQVQARPSVAQRIRKSLFGAGSGGQAGGANHVKV